MIRIVFAADQLKLLSTFREKRVKKEEIYFINVTCIWALKNSGNLGDNRNLLELEFSLLLSGTLPLITPASLTYSALLKCLFTDENDFVE